MEVWKRIFSPIDDHCALSIHDDPKYTADFGFDVGQQPNGGTPTFAEMSHGGHDMAPPDAKRPRNE